MKGNHLLVPRLKKTINKMSCSLLLPWASERWDHDWCQLLDDNEMQSVSSRSSRNTPSHKKNMPGWWSSFFKLKMPIASLLCARNADFSKERLTHGFHDQWTSVQIHQQVGASFLPALPIPTPTRCIKYCGRGGNEWRELYTREIRSNMIR